MPTYVPFLSIPIDEVISSLPSTSIVFIVVSSLPTLNVARATPPSTPLTSYWGIPHISFMTPTNFPSVPMPISSSTLTMEANTIQPIGSRIFTPNFSQPTILIPKMGMVTLGNVWGGSYISPSQLRKTLLLIFIKPCIVHCLEVHCPLVLFLEGLGYLGVTLSLAL